jgi:hypothetical protein
MKKTRFTTEQIIAILQEHAAGGQAAELIRRHSTRARQCITGNSSTTICRSATRDA